MQNTPNNKISVLSALSALLARALLVALLLLLDALGSRASGAWLGFGRRDPPHPRTSRLLLLDLDGGLCAAAACLSWSWSWWIRACALHLDSHDAAGWVTRELRHEELEFKVHIFVPVEIAHFIPQPLAEHGLVSGLLEAGI